MQRAESFGMETLAVLSSEHERMAEYTLAYSSSETATLLLSLQNGEVTEFMLTMRRPMPPAPLTADANWFCSRNMMHSRRSMRKALHGFIRFLGICACT